MSRGKGTRGFRVLALTAAVGLATASFASVPVLLAATASPAAATVSGSLAATASSSWQTNSEVRQMAYSDGRVWLVGSFTAMRPPGYRLGHHETDATYFAALDAATGALDTAIDHTHTFTGGGYQGADEAFAVAASPDGDTVYVGGNFTAVDGYSRSHIAAFSATTGALLPWSPTVDGKVSAIAAAGQSVYIGGTFSTVDGSARANLAAVSASTADLVPGWAPTTNDTVDALAVTSDDATVVAGGYFDQVDGQTSSGTTTYNKAVLLAGVTSSDPGTPLPMPADAVVPPGMPQAPVHDCDSNVKDVVISSGVAYFANEGTGDGCFDGTWAASLSSGQLVWVNRCLGATQAVAVVGDYLYKGSHAHNCQQTNTNHDPANFPQVPPGGARHLLSEKLSNGFLGPWYPLMNAGPDLGPRTMATDGQQLYVGGDFTTVNRTGQQGIARFRTTPDYPTPMSDAPVVTSVLPGRVTVSAKPPVDLDNPQLTMELFVAGTSHPIRSTVVTSLLLEATDRPLGGPRSARGQQAGLPGARGGTRGAAGSEIRAGCSARRLCSRREDRRHASIRDRAEREERRPAARSEVVCRAPGLGAAAAAEGRSGRRREVPAPREGYRDGAAGRPETRPRRPLSAPRRLRPRIGASHREQDRPAPRLNLARSGGLDSPNG